MLTNVFSDPALRARQDQLNGQWNSLWSLYQGCNDTPDSTFAEMATDKKAWDDFYESGSDWSSDSKHATDSWQAKAQEWSRRLASWGCNGTIGPDPLSSDSSAIPTVKDAPPDGPGFIDTALDSLRKTENSILSPFATLGWVAVGLAVVVVLAIVWIVTKGHAKGYGVEVGGK